jgi:hypothetical protein
MNREWRDHEGSELGSVASTPAELRRLRECSVTELPPGPPKGNWIRDARITGSRELRPIVWRVADGTVVVAAPIPGTGTETLLLSFEPAEPAPELRTVSTCWPSCGAGYAWLSFEGATLHVRTSAEELAVEIDLYTGTESEVRVALTVDPRVAPGARPPIVPFDFRAGLPVLHPVGELADDRTDSDSFDEAR